MGLVSRYIIEVHENLRLLLKQPVDREMLHRFRVQVKKMKAIWAIHPIAKNIAFKISFPTITKLYKMAAFIRDRQMVLTSLETLPAFPQCPELAEMLQSGIKRHRKKMIEQLKSRRLRFAFFEENRIFLAYFKLASGTLIRQNRKEFKHATLIMMSEENGKNPERLHDLRRQCKYLLYQCQAFHSIGTHKENNLTKEKLDHLQHSLGDWHDWWNALEWLKKQAVDKKEDASLQSLCKQAGKKEEMLRREILKEIQSVLHGKESGQKN